MKIISDILEVYKDRMKKTNTYMPTTIMGALNRFELEKEDMEKQVDICPTCGGLKV